MRQDLRFALRMIAVHRWFSAAVVVTLAFGIGLNTMVFTLVNAVLFKPVPVPRGERLVIVSTVNRTQTDPPKMPLSLPDFRDYRAQVSTLEAMEAATWSSSVLSEPGIPPHHYDSSRVSPDLFRMLRTAPIQGRDFVPDDAKSGAATVVLLSASVWKERYGGAPNVVGRVVRVDGKPATIIGIMPPGFRFPNRQELWMPLNPTPELEDRANRSVQMYGILKPGVSMSQASADFDVVARRLAAGYPQADKNMGMVVQTFNQRFNGGTIKIVFLLMMAAVGFVLLIACANVANMMLGRALSRRREVSIRAALGASRWRIVRQLLTESLLLSALGGLAGFALSALGVHGFDLATQAVGKPYYIQFTVDYRVVVWFTGICIASAFLFGLVPAWRSSGADLNGALKDGGRTAGTRHGGWLAGALVVFQFALTLVLLMGAGVFMRSFVEKQAINSWIRQDRVIMARLDLPKERYPDAGARQRFFDRLLPRLAILPGVTSLAAASNRPGTGSGSRQVEIEGAPSLDATHRPWAAVVVESPSYARTIELPILRGREFNATDGDPGHHVAIVTNEFATRFWPRGEALGRRFRFYQGAKPGDWIEVSGISADLVQQPFDSDPNPLLFIPYRMDSSDSMDLIVRTAGGAAAIAAPLRSAVQEIDQDLPLYDVRTLAEEMRFQIWFLRLFGSLFLAFSLIALLMASVGIYAVMAQATGNRTREIGVRMALGATSAGILRLVLRRGTLQLAVGLALGLAAAWPATRAMARLPFLTSPSDPAVFGVTALLLAAVGLLACWVPARRAARLDPVGAIRDE